ncbi:CubicO group peptidase, beta-lactamase class C family [Mucilaginibacter gossypiicola]|uniref:CubicO group peptidase, beta-lactamase class C family n=1 Tax=Mucilaginibacter gossypiicola TaxID=551995 RepID=A0A1H7ZZN7_9SPHI|nr:serine hydrolase domain-containing protein [Mucilaginibacter gossypiicola]SEM63935.1 CubicO group peptidase, beta-lactamase class C family [Mucilaginibacter gossypiicola]
MRNYLQYLYHKYRRLFTLILLVSFVFRNTSEAQIATSTGKIISNASMDSFLQKQMDSLKLPGLSIAFINKGKIIYHRALGVTDIKTKKPVDEQSVFEAASLSKPVFAYWVMKLVDRGVLNLDTPLYKYLPYPDIAQDERYKLITARMVLSHQSGFPNWRFFTADSSLHVKPGALYLNFKPGASFGYSGEGFLYLGKVVAHLLNRSLQNMEPAFEKDVAQLLHMPHSSYTANPYILEHKVKGHQDGHIDPTNGLNWPILPSLGIDSNTFNPAASLHTNALDYAAFIIALMKDKGLSSASFREMYRPQLNVPLPEDFRKAGYSTWGLGIAIAQSSSGTVYLHSGNNGNFQSAFMMDKARKSGYVFFTNCDHGNVFNEKLEAFLSLK